MHPLGPPSLYITERLEQHPLIAPKLDSRLLIQALLDHYRRQVWVPLDKLAPARLPE